MIQDIFPHKLYNPYQPDAEPAPEAYALYFDGGKLTVMQTLTGKLILPRVADFPKSTEFTYLFRVDTENFFLVKAVEALPENCVWSDVMTLRRRGTLEKHLMYAVLTGKHLADWYRDTKFCGRCGTRMEHSKTERAMKCPKCTNTVYPRIMPAVIVGVTNGDKLLLTRYRVGYGHNALIAGFTEIGETAEETVAREVMEEAGIRVKNIRYYKTQPWGIANDLLLGYFCDVDGDTEIHMDNQELKYAQWVPREEIVLQPDDFSMTNEMMMLFREGKV